ncbi:carboxylate--amine ligase [Peptoniphilus stercorisuis]|uniref:ATP-grasp superfamily ATP-dependent carboligase n=1 Tax=Peptoniphilus stercorisuis TaxID=1436965 RepID=A0ABS4KEA1_9FIRM|nr:carboxylate--amine ligase [Peptoniphilus stercorisuis]MBP2026092.1 putative ATP-grasp superfamily ATP-dependent carboligase [Peptoniphilus stercorisuis]
MKNKAVVLGTNYYIGLSIIRCLGRENIDVISMDYEKYGTYGSKSKYLKKQLICPHYEKESEKLKDFLIEFAKNEKYKPVLYPTADQYCEFIDKYLLELRKYYHITMDKKGFWTRVMDKDELYKMALKYNMPVPESVSIKEENFIEKVKNNIGFPCLVKPTDSPKFVEVFREKLFICNNINELESVIKRIKKENLDIIVQRKISGFDDQMYTFDAYLDKNSNITHWVTCRKHRQFPINYGASVYTEQVYEKELYEICAPFFKGINYKGFGEIELKKDANTGKFYMIEINARTTNLNALLDKVGVNFPYIAYREMIDKPLEGYYIDYNSKVYFRYLQEDLMAIRDYLKTKQISIYKILKSLFNKKAPAIFSIKDPIPGLYYLIYKLNLCKKTD